MLLNTIYKITFISINFIFLGLYIFNFIISLLRDIKAKKKFKNNQYLTVEATVIKVEENKKYNLTAITEEKEVYLMKAYLKKIEDSLILQDIELAKNPEDNILVIDDLATATLVRRQLENFVDEVDIVKLEPIYNFQII